MDLNRRTALGALAAAPLLAAGASLAAADPPPRVLAPVPLPFDPKKLPGLSEKLLVSHHDNNYAGAVKNLIAVRAALAETNKDTPAFVLSGLRERELNFSGSVVMHELYFGNLGGDGKAAGALLKTLPADWQERLRASAMSLAGGSGWATLSLSLHSGDVNVGWASNHTQSSPSSLPLLVIDMYEHAYALDHGAAAAKYVDAVFANLAWDVVDRRYARARQALAACNAT